MTCSSSYRWLNEKSQLFLERGYLLPGQTVDERVNTICRTAERILGIPGYGAKLKDYFQRGWYSFSTPVWVNFGTERGMPISCFNSHIEDSIYSILNTHLEAGMMSKIGGGTSGYFGEIRPRGSLIQNGANGETHGAVHFMLLYELLMDVISQGSSRRGSFAAYLPVEHGDIDEFLSIRSEGSKLQKLHTGITVGDSWLEEMVAGDQEKRRIWAKVLSARMSTGYPYIMFRDTVNRNNVDVYRDKSLEVKSSNLCCVTGDQRVVSDRGLLTARELYEQGGELTLFSGKEAVQASPMMMVSESEPVFRIELENGMTHTVTACHKVATSTGVVRADSLSVGARIAIQRRAGVFGKRSMEDEAFLLGLYQSDGTQHEDRIMLDVWEHDFNLIEEVEERFARVFRLYGCDKYEIPQAFGGHDPVYRTIDPPTFHECCVNQSEEKKKRLTSNCLRKALNFEKGVVPQWIWESNESTQWQYVRGLFADGTVSVSNGRGSPLYLSIANVDKAFLSDIQLILANLGVHTSLGLMRKGGKTLLPDGCGGKRLYDTKDCFRLVCSSKNTARLFEDKTGFLSRKNVALEDRAYRDNTKKFHKIKSITPAGTDAVYCCEVFTGEHLWVCNGVITHNSEITLPSSPEESFVCDLGSMNILYYDEWKDTDAVEVMVFLLDAVMTEFVEKAKNEPGLERAARFAERHRALGLGWLGWHSYLQSKMIAFESMEAKAHNVRIAKHINEAAWEASRKLAQMFGEPELLKGYGRRNTTLTAIAPTKSSAFIIGQVSEGIEPHRANYFVKDLQKGKFTVRNPHLEALLEAKGKNTEEVWASILQSGGSVQHLQCLTDEEKEVFKTFSEISPRELVIQAAQRQPYIDQSQSLNLFIDPQVPVRDVNALILEAWKLGVKTLYYQINENAAQQLSRSILSCSSCEG